MSYTTEEIIGIFEEEGVGLTENINEAIYIFDNGAMLSGMFVDGIRSEEHRTIELLFDDTDRSDEMFWEKVVERTRVAQYIPETEILLLKTNQELSPKQQAIVEKYDLTVERF